MDERYETKGRRMMKTTPQSLILPVLLLAMTPALVLAHPMRVRTAGSESQTVTMCPNCEQPLDCARAGDYRIDLAVDVQHRTNGGRARFEVSLNDRAGLPVSSSQVMLVLTMIGGEQPPRYLRMKAARSGRYTAETTFRPIDMQNLWRAEIKITAPKGDIVSQKFTLDPWPLIAAGRLAR
jgi:hypothetical protein